MLRHLLLSCLLSCTAAMAQVSVRVGILRSPEHAQVLVTSTRGRVEVWVDGRRAGEFTTNDGLRLKAHDGIVEARSLDAGYDASHLLELRSRDGGYLHVSTGGKSSIERDYPGVLEFRANGSALAVVNNAPIDEYVAGVVQSEAGDNKPAEYYKLQAVSCRTYALANLRRHLADGYAVCDNTHCQVYKGRCTLAPIREAVEATRNMVVVDADIHLIHATFHSNCGGETMNAEDLWSKSEPYLVSTVDTFCLNSPHATWHRTMSRTAWLAYLQRAFHLDLADTASVHAVTDFAPTCRSLYIDHARPLIPLEQVRDDMKFNSAWFTIWSTGDDVVFDGRGFGHGVGLCQEGAMHMAASGLSFTEILHHYFASVHLVDLNTLDFFRDE